MSLVTTHTLLKENIMSTSITKVRKSKSYGKNKLSQYLDNSSNIVRTGSDLSLTTQDVWKFINVNYATVQIVKSDFNGNKQVITVENTANGESITFDVIDNTEQNVLLGKASYTLKGEYATRTQRALFSFLVEHPESMACKTPRLTAERLSYDENTGIMEVKVSESCRKGDGTPSIRKSKHLLYTDGFTLGETSQESISKELTSQESANNGKSLGNLIENSTCKEVSEPNPFTPFDNIGLYYVSG